MKDQKSQQEHPLANILINVLIPVFALSYLSKDPVLQQALGKSVKPWHIGPVYAMMCALVLPIGYGIWHFIRSKKANFFSALGLISVILTGGLTIYLWNKNGTVKPHAGILFGLKEAMIPLMLGMAVLMSHSRSTPLLKVFLFNDSIFDIHKIENRVQEISVQANYDRILLNATRLFAASFFLSSLMNFALAQWFFSGFDHTGANALEEFNTIIGRVMGWGFAVIGVPILVFLFFTLRQLLKDLRSLTGYKDDELLLPR